jgi:glycerol-3-phosphate dehydrogenase (NAD(P)+)
MRPRLTILGAGAMGSAFGTPATRAGFEVNLWGTRLDTEIVAELRAGRPHPRTGAALPDGVRVFDHLELERALAGSATVACAIASEGVRDVLTAAAAALAEARSIPRAVLLMSKGFADDPEGRVELLTEAAARALAERGIATPVVAVGGPCKANEVAAGTPTASVYAAADQALARRLAGELATDDYAIEPSRDPTGVEVAAALKNVFAIALGICDGLTVRTGLPRHDLKAAAFARAVAEIAAVVTMCGGDAATAYGLAGVGDLEVTGLSGRNRAYGELIGGGMSPGAAFEKMAAEGLTVEGRYAAPFAARLVAERAVVATAWAGSIAEPSRPGTAVRTPLLDFLAGGLAAGSFGDDVERALARAVLPPRFA